MNNAFFSIEKLLRVRQQWPMILVVAAGLFSTGCSDSQAVVAADKDYFHQAQSDVLQQQSHYQITRKFVGKVQARQNANIGFEQNGKVASLFVNEGEQVKQGDKLAQQDIQLLNIDRQELQARLSQTTADLALVKLNLKRIRALKQGSFTSQRTLDELETRQQGLLASKRQFEAGLQSNQLRIEKSTLYAPFDAVVSKRFISVGEVIGAGTPALNILQTGKDEVKVGVPVDFLAQLSADQVSSVIIGQQSYPVKLLTKGLDVDQVTRTVQLRFQLADDADVINGQLVYLHLPQQYQGVGYWVPMTALTDGVRGLWNVYTLMPDNQSELFTLQSRNVQILYATKEAAYISGAISDGERYLTAGLHRLVPGQQVKTTAHIPVTFSANGQAENEKPNKGTE